MLLRRAHRQPFVHDDADRELIHDAVHAQDGQGAAFAASQDGLPQRLAAVGVQVQDLLSAVVGILDAGPMRLHADRVDTGIRAAPARHFLKHIHHVVDLGVVDRLGTGVVPGHLQPFREPVDGDDPLGAE